MIKFEYGWDWHLFSTPSIECGDTVGYPYVMLRLLWFWFSVEYHKN